MRETISRISAIIGSETPAHGGERIIDTLLTDSRSLATPEHTLFISLSTTKDSGDNYIPALYAAGVRNFVVAYSSSLHETAMPEAVFLRVENPLGALQRLGAYSRSCLPASVPVVGITGSTGKTTLKEWLFQMLHSRAEVTRSPRSFNSQIGVPLSLWELDPSHTGLAIIEAGVSKTGEMEKLRRMIEPTVGIFTNLGAEHSEGFEDMDNKAIEKCLLFSQCDAVVYNADNPHITNAVSITCQPSTRHLSWSRNAKSGAEIIIISEQKADNITTLNYSHNGNTHILHVPGTKTQDTEHAMHSLALLLYLGYTPQEIDAMLAHIAYFGTRIEVTEGCNNCVIFSDNYTNDCHSLQQALEFMARRSTPQSKRTAIITDMVAEGSGALPYEMAAGLLHTFGFSRVVCIGSDISRHRSAFSAIPEVEFYTTTPQFIAAHSVSDFANELILVKGKGEFGVSSIVEFLEARRNETVLEVNLDAVAANFSAFRNILNPDTKIVCMLKASGYGAGSYELAKTLQDRGAGYLAVAVVDEGAELRNAGITMPIMVLNPKLVDYRTLFTNRLEPEIFSIEMCREIIDEARKLGVSDFPVHIKIDSGMHRLGFRREQLPELINLLGSQSHVYPASIFTHLAVADDDSPAADAYTHEQLDYFEECSTALQNAFPQIHIMRHALNSAGILRFTEHQYDMVRLGIGLYGIAPCNGNISLTPVSTLRTIIISIKKWSAGTTIGYGRRGVLERDSLIATIPIGYADGISRRCGCGTVNFVVNGVKCPTVGSICMDACMIDVTDAAPCHVGDSVEVFGSLNPASVIAEQIGTIPYEILTSVSPRVKRIYYHE